MRIYRFLALAFAFALPAMASDLEQIVKKVDSHYNSLQSMRAEFVETYAGNGIERTESGVLLLKKPGKMRWDYQQPREKLFLTNGKTAWFYVPSERQGRKAPVKELSDLRSPLRYLLGKTRLAKEFEGLSLAPDVAPLEAGDSVLRGIPKGLEDRVTEVVMEVTPDGHIVRILLHEVDGAITDFRFRHIVDNPALSDAQFAFTPPEGVEMVEGAVSF